MSYLCAELGLDDLTLVQSMPPDRGVASKQMLGKKGNKFRITVMFLTNSLGTEKWPIFYIGKWKFPRCFGKKGPNERGFYYRNNKTAWMTRGLFEEYVCLQYNFILPDFVAGGSKC